MTQAPATVSYSFTGVITQAQTKTHRRHAFTVPAGATDVDLSLSFGPPRVGHYDNKLTLTLFDPHGFRGEGHRGGHQHLIHLDGLTATPGFLPGRLPPGKWTVQLNAQAALASDPPLQYGLDVTVRSGTGAAAPIMWAPAPLRVLSTEPGWFRGELHSHTVHSDGHWTLRQMWERGRELGLDFMTLTDHNTISGLSDAAGFPSGRPLFIPGLEITSFRGHALALGVDRWIDWRAGAGGRSSEDWINDVHAAGGLFAIAHPFTEGDPGCTGCNWEYPLPKPGPSDRIEAIEICNEDWDAPSNDNPMCLALWRRLLTPTGGPTAIAGADAHSSRAWGPRSPSTWVYARELSPAGILDGIRKGHVVVSFGPWLSLSVGVPGTEVVGIPGSHLSAGHVTLRVEWSDAPSGVKLRILKRGEILREPDVEGAGELVVLENVTEPSWYGAELWGRDGAPLAISNPIYMLPDSPA